MSEGESEGQGIFAVRRVSPGWHTLSGGSHAYVVHVKDGEDVRVVTRTFLRGYITKWNKDAMARECESDALG